MALLAALLVVLLCRFVNTANGAGYIVAASNSLPSAKARADVVCNGQNDVQLLYESFRKGPWINTIYDGVPDALGTTQAFAGQSIEWLPGDYFLTSTLVISQSIDTVLHAEGTRLFYRGANGDAVVLTGCIRCRLYFGTIFSNSTNAALASRPATLSKPFMPVLMSEFHATGLIGGGGAGSSPKSAGLELTGHTCTNQFRITDIRGFHMGIWINPSNAFAGKIDTNWFWSSYIRMVDTCVVEGCDPNSDKVDSNQFHVNVDASNKNSIGIRTCAMFGRWFIIMGTYAWNKQHDNSRSVVLDKGAQWNLLYITPPLWQFAPMEDNSGHKNNAIYQLQPGPEGMSPRPAAVSRAGAMVGLANNASLSLSSADRHSVASAGFEDAWQFAP